LRASSPCIAIRSDFGIGRARPPDTKATRTFASTRISPPRVTRWRSVMEAPFTSSGSVVISRTSSMRAGLRNSMVIERTTK